MTNAEAAQEADVVIVAVPWEGHASLLAPLAAPLAGKIVIDCVNPMGFDQRGAYPLPVAEGSAAQLAGGSLSAAQQINIAGGTLSGFGAITGSVHNAGTVSPSTTGGVLTVSGTYQQTSAGVLSSVITGTTPGTKFGQLSVGGQATLAGTLKVSTGNGFTPSHGESFSVLLYHSRSGKFSTTSGSPAYTVTYAATAAKAVYP